MLFVEIKAGHPKEIDRFPLLVSALLFLCGCFFLIKGTHFSTARSLSPFFCLISLIGIVEFEKDTRQLMCAPFSGSGEYTIEGLWIFLKAKKRRHRDINFWILISIC